MLTLASVLSIIFCILSLSFSAGVNFGVFLGFGSPFTAAVALAAPSSLARSLLPGALESSAVSLEELRAVEFAVVAACADGRWEAFLWKDPVVSVCFALQRAWN